MTNKMQQKARYHSIRCKRGHPRTDQNCWINPKDNRIYCRVCWRIRAELNREKNRLQARNHYHKHKAEIRLIRNAMNKSIYKRIKTLILTHYGNGRLQCICCGEKTYEFLTIDHINNNGNSERKIVRRTGHNLYRYLRKHKFPLGYQTLCFNCNSGKQINKGICPHKLEKTVPVYVNKLYIGYKLQNRTLGGEGQLLN